MKVYKGRRGEYTKEGPSLVSYDNVSNALVVMQANISSKLISLYENDFNDLMNQNKESLEKSKFWENDSELLDEYLDFYKQIKSNFIDNKDLKRDSRNNLIQHNNTCMSSVQLHDDTLIITYRSQDLDKGRTCDLYQNLLLGQMLGVKKLYVFSALPHYYLDKTKVARRK